MALSLDNRLMSMLKEELSTEEQQLFCASFHAYLNHDPKTDFVVDLDDVYEWLGFTTKGNAKRTVVTSLSLGEHYKSSNVDEILLHLKEKHENTSHFDPTSLLPKDKRVSEGKSVHGGQNRQAIMMTVDGFTAGAISYGTPIFRPNTLETT